MTTVKIVSFPKNAPFGSSANNQEFTSSDLDELRQFIGRMHEKHRKESKWYEIYKDGQLIYDSALLRK